MFDALRTEAGRGRVRHMGRVQMPLHATLDG
jgi:hypothetical protein